MVTEFLSCDWGSTSFRLRRVSISRAVPTSEVRSNVGARILHEQAVQQSGDIRRNRARLFEEALAGGLEQLASVSGLPGAPLPLVVSGMATSSVGWQELPYAPLPFDLAGSHLAHSTIAWRAPSWIGPTHLISGIAGADEILRGEECQILGIMSMPAFVEHQRCCTLILPGTHSKHVRVERGSAVDFRTAMTGELFDVLGRHSLLRASVDLESNRAEPGGSTTPGAAELRHFKAGVQWGAERGLAHGLFRVRTRSVLDGRGPAENTWFLSGLLIGAELSDITTFNRGGAIILAATHDLAALYRAALGCMIPKGGWIEVPPGGVDRAAVMGHVLFLRHVLHQTAP